jgi:hypothetical protein
MTAQAKIHRPDSWTLETLALAADLAARRPRLARAEAAGVAIEAVLGHDSLWLVTRRPNGAAFALRTAHVPGGVLQASVERKSPLALAAAGPGAGFRVAVAEPGPGLLRVTTWITPSEPLLIAFWPRDLYPLGQGDDPTRSAGEVLAAQRGFNAPIVFLRLDDPAPAALLYFQNLTALNPWFEATGAKPDGVVGGQWPELGYQPLAAAEAPSPPKDPLPAGRELVLSDVFLHLPDAPPQGEVEEARLFLHGLAAVYPHLDRPKTEFRDWPAMAERSLRNLARSPKVGVRRYGSRYLRPYTDAEVPDSMVQLAVSVPIRDYGDWRGRPVPLEQQLTAGAARFFDKELGTIRRYLPNVATGGEPIEKARDKDYDQVDSWYLYHPLANLGRLALAGEAEPKRLFLGSLDYAIKVARHFRYDWPVLFDVRTLEVDQADRKDDGLGQTDVGGLYAYVMLQAHELTGEARYLAEAKAAIKAEKGLGFELLYQTNITAWGVLACARLWKLTGDPQYHDRMLPFVAGFFHNTVFWESRRGAAKHYQTFLGATCLHDGPYMAVYECFESFRAFRDYLELCGADCDPAVRLLLNEYCRMTLSRAWTFYPSELPEEILAKEIRNGHIDRGLAMPLEDLYADGAAPGQVGQEVYGSGAAFVFASRAFHRAKGVPFTVFCDYPLRRIEAGKGRLTAMIDGWPEGGCRLRVLDAPEGLKAWVDGKPLRGRRLEDGAWEAQAPGVGRLELAL